MTAYRCSHLKKNHFSHEIEEVYGETPEVHDTGKNADVNFLWQRSILWGTDLSLQELALAEKRGSRVWDPSDETR